MINKKIEHNNIDKQNEILKRFKELEKSTPGKRCLDKSFTIDEIQSGITKLKTGKSNGPDNIINEFLIHGEKALSAPISKLF